MQELIYNQYKKLNVQGASKKTWYNFYRKLCCYNNIDRRIQLGLRGVPIEDIMEKCKELVEASGSVHTDPPFKNKENKTQSMEPPRLKVEIESESESVNDINNRSHSEIVPPSPTPKVLISFSILVDMNGLNEILKLINAQSQTLQTVSVTPASNDPFSRK